MSSMKILETKGPNIKPRGITRIALAYSLYAEPVFVLCLRQLR